ncbi:MAG: tetratricopeptide repeat protein [Thermoplasmata archaeon]|nr:tetratricopeptide repeat protein [Thermoplasmata archaeon]
MCGSAGTNLCPDCNAKIPFFRFGGAYPGDSVIERFNAVFGRDSPVKLETVDDYNRFFELLQIPLVPVKPGAVFTIGDIRVINAGIETLKSVFIDRGEKIQNTDFLLRLASLYCMVEKKGEPAIILGKIVLSSEPENINANLVCGFGYLIEGKPTDASTFFDAVLEKQPQNAIAWYGKALVMKASGRWGAAIQFLNEAIKIDENLYLAHLEKAKILFNQQRYEDADRAADASIRIMPDIGDAWAVKAEILNAEGKWGGAYQCLNQAISLEPLNIEYLIQKAKLLIAHDRKNEAKEILNEIIDYENSEETKRLLKECE